MNFEDNKLVFEEDEHIYTYDGIEQTSVTTLLKDYFPFDRIAAADTCLSGRNPRYRDCKTREDVWALWEAKAQFGTDTHTFCEDLLNGEFVSITNDFELAAFKYINRMNIEEVHTELKIVAPQWGVAGMIDALVKSNGKWYIFDWKTDKAIRREGYKGATCEGVLYGMPQCNLTKFEMQMGIYRYILTHLYHIPIKDCYVVHITERSTKEYRLRWHVPQVEGCLTQHITKVKK